MNPSQPGSKFMRNTFMNLPKSPLSDSGESGVQKLFQLISLQTDYIGHLEEENGIIVVSLTISQKWNHIASYWKASNHCECFIKTFGVKYLFVVLLLWYSAYTYDVVYLFIVVLNFV